MIKQMDEETIIKAYNAGIESVITLVKDINASFTERFDKMSDEINRLNSRITELEVRLNKNSSNNRTAIRSL
jgi:predicted nuclease with TOPRIM domain